MGHEQGRRVPSQAQLPRLGEIGRGVHIPTQTRMSLDQRQPRSGMSTG